MLVKVFSCSYCTNGWRLSIYQMIFIDRAAARCKVDRRLQGRPPGQGFVRHLMAGHITHDSRRRNGSQTASKGKEKKKKKKERSETKQNKKAFDLRGKSCRATSSSLHPTRTELELYGRKKKRITYHGKHNTS